METKEFHWPVMQWPPADTPAILDTNSQTLIRFFGGATGVRKLICDYADHLADPNRGVKGKKTKRKKLLPHIKSLYGSGFNDGYVVMFNRYDNWFSGTPKMITLYHLYYESETSRWLRGFATKSYRSSTLLDQHIEMWIEEIGCTIRIPRSAWKEMNIAEFRKSFGDRPIHFNLERNGIQMRNMYLEDIESNRLEKKETPFP